MGAPSVFFWICATNDAEGSAVHATLGKEKTQRQLKGFTGKALGGEACPTGQRSAIAYFEFLALSIKFKISMGFPRMCPGERLTTIIPGHLAFDRFPNNRFPPGTKVRYLFCAHWTL